MEAATRYQIHGLFREWAGQLRRMLRSETGKNMQLVLASQVISGVFGFALNLLIIRRLNIKDFGLFALFNSTFMLLGGFLHLGLADTYVRFGSIHRQQPFFRALQRNALVWILLASSVLAAGCFFLAPHLVERIYHRPEALNIFRMSVLLAAFNTWALFFLSNFRVNSDYRALAGMNFIPQLLRLLTLTGILFWGVLSLESTMMTYVCVSFVVVCVCFIYEIRSGIFASAEPLALVPPEIRREVFSYNGWIFFNIVTFTLIGNIDAQILAYYHANRVVAEFGVTGRLTLPFYLLITAINTTILPRMSASHTAKEVKFVLSRLALVLLPTAAFLGLIVVFGVPMILWIAGPKYAAISTLMKLQLLSVLLIVIWYPLAVILQAMGHARSVALLSLLQLVVDLALDFSWIPTGGAEGAVRATLVINLIGLLWVVVAMTREVRRI